MRVLSRDDEDDEKVFFKRKTLSIFFPHRQDEKNEVVPTKGIKGGKYDI